MNRKLPSHSLILAGIVGFILPNGIMIWVKSQTDLNIEWIRLLVLTLTTLFVLEVKAQRDPKTYREKTLFFYSQIQDRVVFCVGLTLTLMVFTWPVQQEIQSNGVFILSIVLGVFVNWGVIQLFGTSELKAKNPLNFWKMRTWKK